MSPPKNPAMQKLHGRPGPQVKFTCLANPEGWHELAKRYEALLDLPVIVGLTGDKRLALLRHLHTWITTTRKRGPTIYCLEMLRSMPRHEFLAWCPGKLSHAELLAALPQLPFVDIERREGRTFMSLRLAEPDQGRADET